MPTPPVAFCSAPAATILVAKDGKPWARLLPLEADQPRRQPGLLRGQLQLPPIEALLDPLPPEELDAPGEIAAEHIRWGRRMAYRLLRCGGWTVNHKREQRIWRQEYLQRPTPRKRKRAWPADGSVRRHRAESPHQGWAMDFQFDVTADGRRLRLLNVIDEHSRLCLAIRLGRRCKTKDVVAVLEGLTSLYPAPAFSGTAWVHQPVQPVLNHHRRARWDFDNEMAPGSGSSPSSRVRQRRQASGWCSTTSSTRSIGSSSGPDPEWLGWPPRRRPLPLRRSGGLKPEGLPRSGGRAHRWRAVWRSWRACSRSAAAGSPTRWPGR